MGRVAPRQAEAGRVSGAYCTPGCALACARTGWAHLLTESTAPPAWRLAWCLVGLPEPLPAEQWRDCFAAFEAAHGARELIRGLRLAADQPSLGGWTADRRGRVVDLLDRYEAAMRQAAA
jgi:hypothetical protein